MELRGEEKAETALHHGADSEKEEVRRGKREGIREVGENFMRLGEGRRGRGGEGKEVRDQQ